MELTNANVVCQQCGADVYARVTVRFDANIIATERKVHLYGAARIPRTDEFITASAFCKCGADGDETGWTAIPDNQFVRFVEASKMPRCIKCSGELFVAFQPEGGCKVAVDDEGRLNGTDQIDAYTDDDREVICGECGASDEECGWIYNPHELEDGTYAEIARAD